MEDGWAASAFSRVYMMFLLPVPVSTEPGPIVRVSPVILLVSDPVLKHAVERAADAPVIRQLFSSSPKDPRYHMLSYISHKFQQDMKPQPQQHEPRAALFLNRFTRTLTIVYATNGLANILGISADELRGKSFYYCIQENCLKDAVKCLESAKANDSIAYLRFWFRDPRQDDQIQDEDIDGNMSGEDEDGGVHLDERMDETMSEHAITSDSSVSQAGSSKYQNSTERSSVEQDQHHLPPHQQLLDPNSRTSSGNSSDLHSGASEAIFDRPATRESSTSSLDVSESDDRHHVPASGSRSPGPQPIELEAVVSCTSDGLVVVLRRAKALVPRVSAPAQQPMRRSYENGFFASPWATESLLQNTERHYDEPDHYQPGLAPLRPTAAQADAAAMKGPEQEDFMNSIREVAVFAWSLTGINGSLAQYGRGKPTGESLPPGGLPIWKPDENTLTEQERRPYHGSNPQETRQQSHSTEPKAPPANAPTNRPTPNSNKGYSTHPYDQRNSEYGNGYGSSIANNQGHRRFYESPKADSQDHRNFYESSIANNQDHQYSHDPQHQLLNMNVAGANGSSPSVHDDSVSNRYDTSANGVSHRHPPINSSSYDNHRSWGGEGPYQDGSKLHQPVYSHPDAMDTRDFDQYQDPNNDDYTSYNPRAISNGHEPAWRSHSQQTQHWDGLMPAPTSNHGNAQYYPSTGYHR